MEVGKIENDTEDRNGREQKPNTENRKSIIWDGKKQNQSCQQTGSENPVLISIFDQDVYKLLAILNSDRNDSKLRTMTIGMTEMS